jgi:hypothetical protein
MNQSEIVQIKAFLLALAQLDVDLAQPLHQSIQTLGAALASQATASSLPTPLVAQMHSVLQQHSRLNKLYDESYSSLILYDQLQLQSQGFSAAQTQSGAAPAVNLAEQAYFIQNLAVPILIAEDFASTAREILRRMKHEPQMPPLARGFTLFLERAIASSDANVLAVLEALEKRPLTVTGLVYVVGLTLDQVWTIVRALWQQGYIDRATSNIVYKVFPMLKDRHQSCRTIQADTYLTLTAKGHFHLHPVVSLGLHRNRA